MSFTFRGVSLAVVPVAYFAVVLAVTQRAHAEPATLRLADVVAVAVRQSPELERARIDVDAARAELLRAEGIEDTHVGAQVNGNAFRTTPLDPETEQEVRDISGQASLTGVLSTGGHLGLVASIDRLQLFGIQFTTNGQPVQVPAPMRYTESLAVELTQPLLRGAGSTAFEAPIHQAERRRDAAALQQEARARDLVVSLAQAYWQVAFAQHQLEIRKASLDLADKQLQYTQSAIRTGKVPQSEALAVEQALAVRKQDVIAGEQEVYERSVALRQLAGLEIGPDALAVTTEPLPEKIEAKAPDVAAVVRAVFDHSPDLAALEAARVAAEIGVAAADNAAKSRLDLSIAAGPQGVANGPHAALKSGIQDTGYTVNGSLIFDSSIGQRAEHGGQAAARAALMTAKVAERDARARLAIRTTRAAQRAQAALASISLGEQAISLAEQNIVAEQNRFAVGKSTNFDVLRRLDELEQAKLRHSSSIADYLEARAELDGLLGAILARYGIVMP